jgi:hypothetical protein
MESQVCQKCSSEVTQKFCPGCGHPKVVTRIDAKYVLQELRSVWSFEKGFLFTVRELTTNPGICIKDFLENDRNRLVKPILFLIVTSLIYTISNAFFQFEDGYVEISGSNDPASYSVTQWIQNNYGYANIIMAFFIAGWVKLFFRKSDVNLFEILVLLCFVMGMGMLIYAVFGVIQSMVEFSLMQSAVIVGFIYLTWAIGQFYGKGKVRNYVYAFSAYLLGMITFSVSAILIEIVLDLLI